MNNQAPNSSNGPATLLAAAIIAQSQESAQLFPQLYSQALARNGGVPPVPQIQAFAPQVIPYPPAAMPAFPGVVQPPVFPPMLPAVIQIASRHDAVVPQQPTPPPVETPESAESIERFNLQRLIAARALLNLRNGVSLLNGGNKSDEGEKTPDREEEPRLVIDDSGFDDKSEGTSSHGSITPPAQIPAVNPDQIQVHYPNLSTVSQVPTHRVVHPIAQIPSAPVISPIAGNPPSIVCRVPPILPTPVLGPFTPPLQDPISPVPQTLRAAALCSIPPAIQTPVVGSTTPTRVPAVDPITPVEAFVTEAPVVEAATPTSRAPEPEEDSPIPCTSASLSAPKVLTPRQISDPGAETGAIPKKKKSGYSGLLNSEIPGIHKPKARAVKRMIPESEKDDKYYEKRMKNNLSAKKSRDLRKSIESANQFKVKYYDKENVILRAQKRKYKEEKIFLSHLVKTRYGSDALEKMGIDEEELLTDDEKENEEEEEEEEIMDSSSDEGQ